MSADDRLLESIMARPDAEDVFEKARRQTDDMADDGKVQRPNTNAADEARSEYLMNAPSRQHNTGPKGVLEDYREAKEQLKRKMERDNREKIAFVERSTPTVRTILDDEEEARLLKELNIGEDELQAFMSSRVEQIHRRNNAPGAPAATAAKPQTQKSFGKLIHVGEETFLDFLDKEDPNVMVVIHLYLNHIRACQRLNECLAEIAEGVPTTKFGKLLASECQLDFSEESLPVLIIYKGGELVTSVVNVTENFGHNFDYDDVLEFLKERRFLTKTQSR